MTSQTFVNEPDEKNEPHDEQIYEDYQVDRIIYAYVCAQCWGTLTAQPVPGRKYEVSCPDCGQGKGLVTRKHAESRLVFSHWDYLEARRNLADVLNLKTKPFNEAQALKDLGY